MLPASPYTNYFSYCFCCCCLAVVLLVFGVVCPELPSVSVRVFLRLLLEKGRGRLAVTQVCMVFFWILVQVGFSYPGG